MRHLRPGSAAVRCLLPAFVAASVTLAGLAACGSGGESATDQSYLSEVHGAAADVGQYRSDAELIHLGHAVCDDFSAGASYEGVADRLAAEPGASDLPSSDLGAVITAAADNYCPKYRSDVS